MGKQHFKHMKKISQHTLRWLRSHSPAALSLSVLSFTVGMLFAHHGEDAQSLPQVIFILLHFHLILSFSTVFDTLHNNGVLFFMLSLGDTPFEKLIQTKIIYHMMSGVLLSFVLFVVILFLWTNLNSQEIAYWGGMMFLTGLFTTALSLCMAGLRLCLGNANILSVFLLMPLMISPILFSQSGFDALMMNQVFSDYFYLNGGLSLITSSLSFILIPSIIRQAISA